MLELTEDFIRDRIADSPIIFLRGRKLFENGAFCCREADDENEAYIYDVDGSYGDYIVSLQFSNGVLRSSCSCPYPGDGCKHTVAVLLDLMDRVNFRAREMSMVPVGDAEMTEPWLDSEEIRQQALEDRRKRARMEDFEIILGEMIKGEHLIETKTGQQYTVTLHDPQAGLGHCSCPDFLTNHLGICKHLIALKERVKKIQGLPKRLDRERFPFVDIYWDSVHEKPRLFCERPEEEIRDIQPLLRRYFDSEGLYSSDDPADFLQLLSGLKGKKGCRIRESVLNRLDDHLMAQQLEDLARDGLPSLERMKTVLYPYQEKGVQFALYKRAALIGDEMGLGKTLQAIALGVLKKEIFGFDRILVVTLASLKEQWKREIERFSAEKAVVVAGEAKRRRALYNDSEALFKITNYEAVLRDITILSRFKPDLVILDEAQRIKNFATKTAEAVKSIPRKHALVLTGTPLENKLEDVYSIVQFLDPHLLSPLWKFAADHFMLSREKRGRILGYRNLDRLHERLKGVVIRRRKEEVLSELPDEIVNNYYVELSTKQAQIHNGYLQSLLPLLNKKFLTPMDIRRMQELLLKMRMVCDSTYLVDRNTNLSPKLVELEGILDEIIVQNGRKAVIFSEWTTMTYLIGKHLSRAAIPFVELSGKIPVGKRQKLIDRFTNDPDCKAFLSTDAGGTGLNLQAADCIINVELPWNPARLSQRIGRVSRIGQASKCINVVNLIAKNSIEEKILAGLQLKRDVFEGVFEGGPDMVEFSREKRAEILNKLREMMGEEPVSVSPEQRPSEELPEDTPHYLNPQILQDDGGTFAYEAEEMQAHPEDHHAAQTETSVENAPECRTARDETAHSAAGQGPAEGQSPERLEAVMNSGLQFISGLLEMATGQKLSPLSDGQNMIQVDRRTGEVTMKFKLPGF